jgi:hypothetical protein
MRKHHFTLIVSGSGELTEELANALYKAGCDDATPGTSGQTLMIDFHRRASSLEEALRSAIADVQRAGLDVERVEIDASVLGPAA